MSRGLCFVAAVLAMGMTWWWLAVLASQALFGFALVGAPGWTVCAACHALAAYPAWALFGAPRAGAAP